MRLGRIFPLLLALSPAALVLAVPSFSTSSSHHPHEQADTVPSFPHYQGQSDQAPLRIWPKLRDTVIEALWGKPNHQRKPSLADKPADQVSSTPSSIRARYGDDIVLRFTITNPSEVEALREASNVLFLDVWASTDKWVDIRLSKDVVPSLLGLLPTSLQNAHAPLIHDLAQAVYESYPSPASRPHDNRRPFGPAAKPSSDANNIFFQDYQPYSVIVPWMRLLAAMFPSHVRIITIGTSFEGRDILAFHIGVSASSPDPPLIPRKTILVTAGAHPREWISVATANFVAYSLVTAYGKSKPVTRLLNDYDWIFVPTLNPDGYVYTWEEDRLWRKNRQGTDLPFCRGVDLDRSWGFEWSGEETRNNPCSESYAGDSPFEGVEARVLADWAKDQVENKNVQFVGYLDLHSYSQQVLYPYSFSCRSVPPTLENLEELAIGIAQAIRRTDREHYDVSSACAGVTISDKQKPDDKKPEQSRHLESTGGSALDWFYHELRVPFAYQLKLRDKGSYGFLLPKENIIPTGKEVFNAAVVFGRFLYGPKSADIDWEDDLPLGHKDPKGNSENGRDDSSETTSDMPEKDSHNEVIEILNKGGHDRFTQLKSE